jgi:hypothetical protein
MTEFDHLKQKLESKKLKDTITISELIDIMSDIQVKMFLGDEIKSQDQEIKKLEEELFKKENNES